MQTAAHCLKLFTRKHQIRKVNIEVGYHNQVYIQIGWYLWRSKYINMKLSLRISYGLTKIIIKRNNYSVKIAILSFTHT